MDIQGVGAIVTGGASGLGGATAALLTKRGAKVTVFDVNEAVGQAKAAELGGHFIRVDITDDNAVEAAVAAAEALYGPARVLVSCAGIAPPGKVIGRDGKAAPLADFSKIIAVNLIGTYNVLSKVAARLHDAPLIGEERGVIVNTASIAAFEGQIGQPAYAASKSGVVGMMLPIARELARYGIRVMTIAPGIFMTPMLASLPAEVRESLGRQVPFPNRLGQPEEYAKIVEAIIDNPMLNAEVIRLDGAIRMASK